ncbi:hypothetical protein D3273_23760 [Lichenibacterium minor]|uniref:Uncharacterized protein n=1 Tax=Lichenibacterium minor TaxID=2316528 RepID=A0A4Q2U198_9HYPH|nr:hypothetical protein [Lichenibacterium minor]RYC29458.1 hypothetical protein D3273_23760 [Lichenibacterium minor]
MLLIRTTELSNQLAVLAQSLSAASLLDVAYLIDESGGVVKSISEKVSITREKVERLGVYAPADFGWSCGDYGLYLAQVQYPGVNQFWLIEHDVRISGNVRAFFETMRERREDFLTSRLQPADRYWWWSKTAQARDVEPFRCFFPMGRFSSSAISLLLETRRHQSRQRLRRRLWPNDEAFVSTTMANSDLSVADFNATAGQYHDEGTWTYDKVFKIDDVPAMGPYAPRLYHPVLSEDQIEKRQVRMHTANTRNHTVSKVVRKTYGRLNRFTAWYPCNAG